MRRVKQQLSEEEALEVLKNAKRGVLPGIEHEIRRAASHVQVFALVPEHITGKRVHEA